MIAIVDYKKGNLSSVERGIVSAGGQAIVTSDVAEIARADAIVLPGVGAFADAAATMGELGQMQAIRERLAAGVPFLGICLGLHLLFDAGVEGALADDPAQGLGFIPGVVREMPRQDATGHAFKVPHVGWNSIEFPDGAHELACPLFDGIAASEYFYFTHSYIVPQSDFDVAYTTHSVAFPCAVQKGRAFGVQFHPEKSSDAGARILRNFVELAQA